MATGCVAIVDPYSTGCFLAWECYTRNYNVIAVWSKDLPIDLREHQPPSCSGLVYFAQVCERQNLEGTVAAVRKASGSNALLSCIVGADTGVRLADCLSEALGLRTNGTCIQLRSDKKVQQDLVKAAGLRSVRQVCGTNGASVMQFLETEEMPVVVKPVQAAGSDGVKLCHTVTEACQHVNSLMQGQQKIGSQNASVLCQEFLKGKEYVVDHVSKDGVHKTMMIWVYDKRAVNGAAFVYHGMLPVLSDSPQAKVLIPYVRGVLDALKISNGPSHAEVMMTPGGPCLVEMNCRSHGGDGAWVPLARSLTGGYSQVDATLDCFLDSAAFDRILDKPPSPFLAAGQEVILVSFAEGRVVGMPGYKAIREMDSLLYLEESVAIGSSIERSVDLFTNVGSAILLNKDEVALARDVEAIREMERTCALFQLAGQAVHLARPHGLSEDEMLISERKRTYSIDVAEVCEPNRKGSDWPCTPGSGVKFVAVVDPISTGCCVAKEISDRGYKLIAVWSEGIPVEFKSHVPLTCAGIEYEAEIQYAGSLPDCARKLRVVTGQAELVACICGGETAVELADALSEFLGLRTNGTVIPQRRDKKLQQELVKAAGLRSVRQAGGRQFENVRDFLKSETMPVVVKPVESAGSDGVKLCHTYEEANEHFEVLMNSQRRVGSQNSAVLCQEFLRGKEYVVDSVSHNGIHKTVMIWVYDKRPLNGAAFVYHGMLPISSDSEEAAILIPYVSGVLDALQIRNGPTHGEVMMTESGPCLVEMNCRAHGGDGAWVPLAISLTGGYSQVTATADAYLDEAAFDRIPLVFPAPFKSFGQEVILVSLSRGIVKSTPGYEQIQKLRSCVLLETSTSVGSQVDFSVDLFTTVGSAILVHRCEEVLRSDVDMIRQMEQDNALFEYETSADPLGRPRTGSELNWEHVKN